MKSAHCVLTEARVKQRRQVGAMAKQFTWPMLLGCAAVATFVFMIVPKTLTIIVKKTDPNAEESSPKTLDPKPLSQCFIPGLASMDQYRQYLRNTEITCNDLRQFGGKEPAPPDGTKFLCMDSRFDIKPGDCRVFSFGVNNDWSFEDEFDKFGCKVYAYDPTMGKEDHVRSANIKFFATGISNYRGTKLIGMGNNWEERKVDRFENLVREAGEEGREIDVVKLDVELSEIDFLQDIIFNSPHVLSKIKQIAMEVHDGEDQGLGQTTNHQVFWPYFMLLRCMGFRLISSRNAGAWREVVWARVV